MPYLAKICFDWYSWSFMGKSLLNFSINRHDYTTLSPEVICLSAWAKQEEHPVG